MHRKLGLSPNSNPSSEFEHFSAMNHWEEGRRREGGHPGDLSSKLREQHDLCFHSNKSESLEKE
jgi:hypothetical protein